MNHQDIQAMPAGRRLDGLIANAIFGQQLSDEEIENHFYCNEGSISACTDIKEQLPDYSTDIAAAWTIIETIVPMLQWEKLSVPATFALIPHRTTTGIEWTAGKLNWSPTDHGEELYWDWRIETDSAPLAICRAALIAIFGDT